MFTSRQCNSRRQLLLFRFTTHTLLTRWHDWSKLGLRDGELFSGIRFAGDQDVVYQLLCYEWSSRNRYDYDCRVRIHVYKHEQLEWLEFVEQ
jgi:hypothetical protein